MRQTFEEASLHELPAGSYLVMPKGAPHFGWSRGEAIVQVHGTGPFKIVWVNPADDPLRKPKP